MSYLRYLCLFAYNGVQHILCCVVLRVVYPMLLVSLYGLCLMPLRFFLTFIFHSIPKSVGPYVIKYFSDLRQVGGFLRVLLLPPPIKLTATI